MDNAHIDLVWEDFPSDNSPVDAQNLNTMVNSINIVNKNTNIMDTTKFDTAEAQLLIKDVRLDETSGILIVTHYNGASTTYSSLLSKIAVNFDFDEATQKIILFLPDGEQKQIDLSTFITDYEFIDSDTIFFSTAQIDDEAFRIAWRMQSVSFRVSQAPLQQKERFSIYIQSDVAISSISGTYKKKGESTNNPIEFIGIQSLPGNSITAKFPKGAVSYEITARTQEEISDETKEIIGFSSKIGSVSAGIKEGSIKAKHLNPEYLADLKNEISGLITVDSELSSTSRNPVQNQVITSALGDKVDKISGKSLSSNDYTDNEKDKLDGIAPGAEVNVQADWNETDPTSDAYIKNKPSGTGEVIVDSVLDSTSTNAIQNKVVYEALESKLDIDGTAKKAEALSNTSAVGSANQPVYFNSSGKPVVCTGVTNYRQLTQAEYDALTSVQKMNGTIYFITD